MGFLTLQFFIIIVLAIIMESIDSSLGMMYGTILSPLLIGIGFSIMDVVPSVLLSQTIGGIVASFQHHRFHNASFNYKSKDLKVAVVIFTLGIFAVIIGAVIGVRINKFILSIYISILMLIMGLFVLSGKRFKFSWNKILIIGMISSFNKALSGGGFGPIVTNGQILSGRSSKRSIGTTTMSEVEICLSSFIIWLIAARQFPDITLITALCIGALIGGITGVYLLSKIKNNKLLTKIVAIMAIISGIFALIKLL